MALNYVVPGVVAESSLVRRGFDDVGEQYGRKDGVECDWARFDADQALDRVVDRSVDAVTVVAIENPTRVIDSLKLCVWHEFGDLLDEVGRIVVYQQERWSLHDR